MVMGYFAHLLHEEIDIDRQFLNLERLCATTSTDFRHVARHDPHLVIR